MNTAPADVDESVRALLATATRRLASTADSARLDAELLLAAVLGLDRSALYREPERRLDAASRARFLQLLAERARGRPIAHLTGQREFWSLRLAVTEATLVPRPQTELLVELALVCIDADGRRDVLDLGTGSGAIAVAIAHSRPACRVCGVDRSPGALAVAARNLRQLELRNVSLLECDWYAAFGARCFDLIVANPPYVESADPRLDAIELRHEPRLALDGGSDGLAALRHVVAGAPACLRYGGTLLVEHGAEQGAQVRELFGRAGFVDIDTARDLDGHERVTRGGLAG
ncbi:MAG: peptide chain release factor N(5)-glutamine methyltransferase [Gammaproteobacteria bacterium]|nr:peptide chain release factor N(5)-glutamine methyltransferase [Gammaproteobacteria bacterium]